MAIKRQTAEPTTPTFRVGINITLTGSKRMTAEQQDELMKGLDGVRIIIVEPEANIVINPGTKTLVDETVDAKEFKTGSVGYGLQAVGVEFT